MKTMKLDECGTSDIASRQYTEIVLVTRFDQKAVYSK